MAEGEGVQEASGRPAPDRLALGTAGAYFLCLLLPWFARGDLTQRGIGYVLTGVVPLLLVLAVAAPPYLPDGMKERLGAMARPWADVAVVLDGVALALVLGRLAYPPRYPNLDTFGRTFYLDLHAQPGIYLAVLVLGGSTAGWFLRAAGARWGTSEQREADAEGD